VDPGALAHKRPEVDLDPAAGTGAIRLLAHYNSGCFSGCFATAAFDMRKQTALAAAIAQRTLLSIAVNAKRRG